MSSKSCFLVDSCAVSSTLLVILSLLLNRCYCVTVHEVRFLTDSGKTDFAIAGEGVTFSCLFVLDPRETIQSVIWYKDKERVYLYHKDRQDPPIDLGILKGRIDLTNRSPSTLIIKNTTKEMHGTYTCDVITAKGKSQNEAFLIVIVDACRESSWETTSNMVNCTEDITFYCRGMFPKPAPVCGIYNDVTGSYVQSVSFDHVEKMEDGTYEISLFRRLYAKDWLKHSGQLSFRCFMIVMSTTWRKGIHHRLFGDSGCLQPPPNVSHGFYNITSETTCWGTPREGSKLTYTCHQGFDLLGPASYTCKNNTWKPIPMSMRSLTNVSNKVFPRRIIPKGPQITVCNSSHCLTSASPLVFLTVTWTILFRLRDYNHLKSSQLLHQT